MKPKAPKKPYSRPKLVVHGDLRSITMAKGSSRNDLGRPRTGTRPQA
jgi:hypothetical protein